MLGIHFLVVIGGHSDEEYAFFYLIALKRCHIDHRDARNLRDLRTLAYPKAQRPVGTRRNNSKVLRIEVITVLMSVEDVGYFAGIAPCNAKLVKDMVAAVDEQALAYHHRRRAPRVLIKFIFAFGQEPRRIIVRARSEKGQLHFFSFRSSDTVQRAEASLYKRQEWS